MKNLMKMPFLILSLILMYSFVACNEGGKNEDSEEQAEEANEEKFETKPAEKDAQLMVDLVGSQYYEIRLSNYALQRSMNAEVKEIAGMLVNDHSSLLSNLRALAMQKSISVPNEDSVDINKKIKAWDDEDPSDFDRKWTNEMIDKHKASINKIEKAIDDKDTDADIKSALSGSLPTVKTHLDHLNTCKDKLK